MIASMLHKCAENPEQMKMLFQSLQRLFNNDIQFTGFVQETAYASSNDGGGVAINSKYTLDDDINQAATLVSEINHAIHERPNIPWGGTISVFAAEYRTAYAEALFRTNETPKPEHMRQILSGLLNTQPSSVFVHLRHTYDNDSTFKNLVDWVYEKLADDQVVKPEEMRQALLGLIGKTENIASTDQIEQSWFIDNESPFPDAAAVQARVASQIAFDTLTKQEQSLVVNLVRKYDIEPQAFHKFMQTDNFKQANEQDRPWALRVIGNLASEAAKEGTGSTAYRALNQLQAGRINLSFYQDQSDDRLNHRAGNTCYINQASCQSEMIDDWIIGLNESLSNLILKNN
jgi:hypothetical protein